MGVNDALCRGVKSGCQKSTIKISLNEEPLCQTSWSNESSMIIALPSSQVLWRKNTLGKTSLPSITTLFCVWCSSCSNLIDSAHVGLHIDQSRFKPWPGSWNCVPRSLCTPLQQQLAIDLRVSLPSGSPSGINTLEGNLMLGATQHYR